MMHTPPLAPRLRCFARRLLVSAVALVASLALGIIESFGTIYVGHLLDRDSIAFAFLIMVLMVRPQGLLARG